MEPQERSLNKWISIGGLTAMVIIIALCQCIWSDAHVPDIRVRANNTSLHRNADVLYLKSEPYAGWVDDFYDDGKPAKSTPYVNGKEEGRMQSWYPNRQLEQERYFHNGKKEGVHHGWWPDGKLKFEYQFAGGEHNGSAKEWDSEGHIYRSFHYNKGHEDGLQQMWWDDGSIRANYVVKDGQQYGLIGRKLCKNTLK